VLDGILQAQANGKKIGAPIDPQNPRYFERKESNQPCFK